MIEQALPGRLTRQRHRRRLDVAELLRLARYHRHGTGIEFGVGTAARGISVDRIAFLEARDAGTDLLDEARKISPWDPRKIDRHDLTHDARRELVIDRIHRRSGDPHDHFAALGLRLRHLFQTQLFRTAVRVNSNCLHDSVPPRLKP